MAIKKKATPKKQGPKAPAQKVPGYTGTEKTWKQMDKAAKKAPAKKAKKAPEPKPETPKQRAKRIRKEERAAGLRRIPKEYRECPGGCKDTGKKDGRPCPVCCPTEEVTERLRKLGTCIHNYPNEPGRCAKCEAATIVDKSGVRGSTAGNRKDVYQVFRDKNGVAYLRVKVRKDRESQFIVNKGFQVELISIDSTQAQALALRPVVEASVFEAARRLFTPLNDQVTISVGAKDYLTEILTNKELEMKATTKTAAVPAKSAKFATTQTVPAAPARTKKNAVVEEEVAPKKGAKADRRQTEDRRTGEDRRGAAATPAKKAPAKSNGETRGRTGQYAPEQKIILVEKENPGREGTKRHDWYELYRTKGQTVGGYMEAGGDRGYLNHDAKNGRIQIK